MGILEHAIIRTKREEWPKKSLKELGWKLLSKMDVQSLCEAWPHQSPTSPMNIIY